MREDVSEPMRLGSRLPATVRRALGCLAVSGTTTALSSVVLVMLAIGVGMPAGAANPIAYCCGIPVSYFANRR